MTALPKKRLGRGLAALIGDDLTDDVPATQDPEIRSALREVPIETVRSNSLNPRKHFNEEELQDLARSISEKGILQPVVVRPTGDGETYQIVAGERRWRAAQKAGLHTIPVLVRELSDKEVLEIAIIENVQRADLNPVEEAMGYQQLIDSFDYTQQQLAESIGKSRSHIANTLRLMTLPPAVLERLQRGDLTAGHARALIATDDPVGLSQKIVALGLSVRQAEALARNKSQPTEDTPSETENNSDLKSIEKAISEALGLRVSVQSANGEKGKLIINFKTLDQFEELCNKLGANL
jgi:ParB family transcriptional regulator, chromosome partitioning protein